MAKRNSKSAEHESKSDSNPWSLRGPAVHRLETGQSGLDPLGARQEAAFTEGLFIRNLFTGRFRTRHLSLLLLMGLVGFCFLIPLIFTAIEWLARAPLSIPLVGAVLLAIVGLFFFWNIAASLNMPRSHREDS